MENEYLLEISATKTLIERLRLAEADPVIIEEHEVELRNLQALYAAAFELFEDGEKDARLPQALHDAGFGEWTLDNVYSFVYDCTLENPESSVKDVATIVHDTDFAGTLLAELPD